jgi:phage-related protein
VSIIARSGVELFAQTDDFAAKIKGANAVFENFGKAVSDVGKGMTAGFTAPLLGIGAGLAGLSVNLAKTADDLFDLEQQTGLDVKQLQEYRFAADASGASTDVFANAATALLTRMKEAGTESKIVTESLAALGLSARDSTGHLMPMHDLFPQIIAKLQGVESITERNSLAFGIFGKGATELTTVLGMSSAEFEKLRLKANELGIVLSKESLKSADEFGQQLNVLKASLKGAAGEAGLALMPALKDLARFTQDEIIPAVSKFVKWLADLDASHVKWALGIGAVVASMGPLLIAVGTGITLLPKLQAAMVLLDLSMAPLIVTTGLFVAAFAAVGVATYQLIKRWDDLGDAFNAWGQVIKSEVRGVVMTFENLWHDTVKVVTDMWDGIKGVFTSALDGIAKYVSDKVKAIKDTFQWLSDIVVGHSIIPDMVDLIGGEFERMASAMRDHTKGGADNAVIAFRAFKGDMGGVAGEFVHVMDSQLKDAFGAVDSALTNVGNKIANVFGFDAGGAVAGFAGGLLAAGLGSILGGFANALFDSGARFKAAVAKWRQSIQSLNDAIGQDLNDILRETDPYAAALVDIQREINGLLKQAFTGLRTMPQSGIGAGADWIRFLNTLKGDLSDIEKVKAAIASGDFTGEALQELQTYLQQLVDIGKIQDARLREAESLKKVTDATNDAADATDHFTDAVTRFKKGLGDVPTGGGKGPFPTSGQAFGGGVTLNIGAIHAGFGATSEQVANALFDALNERFGVEVAGSRRAAGGEFITA